MGTDWKTWSPFQSETPRNICAHMTPAEKSDAMSRAGRYGLWCAFSFAIPLNFLLLPPFFPLLFPEPFGLEVKTAAAALVALHIACIPLWMKSQRRFLASTAWAREQGITPEGIKLFGR